VQDGWSLRVLEASSLLCRCHDNGYQRPLAKQKAYRYYEA